MDDKQVFIVPYDKTMDIDHGFIKQKHHNDIWTKYNDIGMYVDKNIADSSIVMQQIIPYTIIKNEEGLYYTATLQQDKPIISIGFGSNILQQDGIMQPLFKGAVRTLFDDVKIESLQPLKFIGTVRDMVNMPKFLGYVFLIDNVENDIKLNNEKLIGKWMTKKELIDNYGKLESWSKHIVNYIVDNPL